MGLFSRKMEDSNEEDYVTVMPQKNDSEIAVRIFNLKRFVDVNSINNALRGGDTIALVNISHLRHEDLTELKRAINHIKKTCDALNGSVMGIDDSWIVAVPEKASIAKLSKGAGANIRSQVVDEDSYNSNL